MNFLRITQAGLALMLSSSLVHVQAADQDKSLNTIIKKGGEITQMAEKSQQKIDAISDQIQSKLQQFKAINKEIDGLKVYNSQLAKQVENQRIEMEQLNLSIDNVSVIERQVTPLMQRMIETLDSFVALDLPFLPEERANRINSLKAMMLQADIAVSEKFRRVLEAYQVEMDYGRTLEAYSGILTLDGQQRDVDFLRIGRVSLIYQTRDGSAQGHWDKASQSWQSLPASARIHIKKGLRIARKQLAPDMISVPLVAAP